MYPYGEHMSGWGYALGIIGMVLFWTVLVLAIAAAVRYLDRKRRESFPPPAPAAHG
jgi:putative membrane protein